MSKIINVGQAKKLLKKQGFSMENQVGSHQKWKKGDKCFTLVVHSVDSEELCRKAIKNLKLVLQ